MKTTTRKLRKLRLSIVVIVFILMVSIIVGGFSAKADAARFASDRNFVPVYIVDGDTLWDLVDKYYDYQGDIREAIYEVKEINNIKGSVLQAGQVIYIPTK